ncbi:MAG: Transcriptional regulatory protein LiaR [Pseudomonadota bacterium]|jgi:DNA-binding NarL/FixJ family response regulator
MEVSRHQSLLIIDDHPVYRDALNEKLTSEFAPQGITVAVAGSANEGLELIENSNQRWVVLLDILMPGLSGLTGIKVFKGLPNVDQVVAISGLDEHAWEPKTASAGASLFLSKNSTVDFIIRKLTPLLMAQGQPYLKNENLEPREFRLTQRQLEVLDLISQGHPNKVIADFMDISEQTVKIHVNQIFKELRVFNRTQAVIKAQKHQLLQ